MSSITVPALSRNSSTVAPSSSPASLLQRPQSASPAKSAGAAAGCDAAMSLASCGTASCCSPSATSASGSVCAGGGSVSQHQQQQQQQQHRPPSRGNSRGKHGSLTEAIKSARAHFAPDVVAVDTDQHHHSQQQQQQQRRPESPVCVTDPTHRYVRQNFIAKGASKRVFRAFDEEEGIEVAWNEIQTSSATDFGKLEREISLLQEMDHENVIKCYGWWMDEARDVICFVTELMTSGTLSDFIASQSKKKLKKNVMLKYARQILSGLSYLHARGVIHRDLKSSNIFINGNRGEVKIGDLGLSIASRTAISVIGTPEYMAPEMYDENYTNAVDIWSFGMVMIEMATGHRPYSECENVAQIFKKVTNGILPNTEIDDAEVLAVICQCHSLEYDQRPSADDLLRHDLFAVFDAEEVADETIAANAAANAAAAAAASEAAAARRSCVEDSAHSTDSREMVRRNDSSCNLFGATGSMPEDAYYAAAAPTPMADCLTRPGPCLTVGESMAVLEWLRASPPCVARDVMAFALLRKWADAPRVNEILAQVLEDRVSTTTTGGTGTCAGAASSGTSPPPLHPSPPAPRGPQGGAREPISSTGALEQQQMQQQMQQQPSSGPSASSAGGSCVVVAGIASAGSFASSISSSSANPSPRAWHTGGRSTPQPFPAPVEPLRRSPQHHHHHHNSAGGTGPPATHIDPGSSNSHCDGEGEPAWVPVVVQNGGALPSGSNAPTSTDGHQRPPHHHHQLHHRRPQQQQPSSLNPLEDDRAVVMHLQRKPSLESMMPLHSSVDVIDEILSSTSPSDHLQQQQQQQQQLPISGVQPLATSLVYRDDAAAAPASLISRSASRDQPPASSAPQQHQHHLAVFEPIGTGTGATHSQQHGQQQHGQQHGQQERQERQERQQHATPGSLSSALHSEFADSATSAATVGTQQSEEDPDVRRRRAREAEEKLLKEMSKKFLTPNVSTARMEDEVVAAAPMLNAPNGGT